MPIIPEIQIETAPLCNLRQTLQWLKEDIKPVEAHFEAILGISSSILSRGYDVEKRQFYASVLAQRINLFGRPGLGKFRGEYRSDLEFESYGDREQVPASKLFQGGFDALDFDSSSFGEVTAWDDDGFPVEAFKYTEIVILTSELFTAFPANEGLYGVSMPPPIKLRSSPKLTAALVSLPRQQILLIFAAVEYVAQRTEASITDAAVAIHNALCSRQLTAEDCDGRKIPFSLWRELTPAAFVDQILEGSYASLRWDNFFPQIVNDEKYCGNPCLWTRDLDLWLAEPTKEAPTLPIEKSIAREPDYQLHLAVPASYPLFLQFLVELADRIGAATLAEMKKEDIKKEIKKYWPPTLGAPSDKKLSLMATILRPPEKQQGGAQKQKRLHPNAPAGDGWNGSTLLTYEPIETEPAPVEPFHP